ncbi:uncharacterized protein METZ01_LOCUS298381, partial [marine metagenome]
ELFFQDEAAETHSRSVGWLVSLHLFHMVPGRKLNGNGPAQAPGSVPRGQ